MHGTDRTARSRLVHVEPGGPPYQRRNAIAHAGDRKGHGGATTVDEVKADLACVVSVVDALDALTRRT